jgi:MFS family permease
MKNSIFFGWWVVLAAALGLATGIASVNLFSFGIFQGPLMAEFGWTRTQVSVVLAVGTTVTVFTSPFVGALVDLYGTRRIALPSIIAIGAALMSLYWLTGNLWHYYFVFALIPIIGAGTSSVAYARIVSRWFDRRRGLALGAALAGVGLGGAIIPRYSQWLIDGFGWRGGYAGLGLLSLCVTLPVAWLCLRDTPGERGLQPDGDPLPHEHARSPALVGFTRGQALCSRNFWLMVAAFLVLGAAIGGVMLQLVPILVERGVEPVRAASIYSALGVSIVLGRVSAGALMDRFHAPRVAVAFLLGPIVGVSLLATGATGTGAVLAAILLGLAAGAEVDVIAYLTGRYFGTRSYGELYGYQYAVWALGAGFAPVLTAAVYDVTGSYAPALWGYVGCFVLGSVLLAGLGRYPRLEEVTVTQTGDSHHRTS